MFTRIKKDHNLRYIPPMGPMIHPDFIKTHAIDIDEDLKYDTLEDNYIDFYRFILNDRFTNIVKHSNKNILSLMEKNDLFALLKITKEYLLQIQGN